MGETRQLDSTPMGVPPSQPWASPSISLNLLLCTSGKNDRNPCRVPGDRWEKRGHWKNPAEAAQRVHRAKVVTILWFCVDGPTRCVNRDPAEPEAEGDLPLLLLILSLTKGQPGEWMPSVSWAGADLGLLPFGLGRVIQEL